MIQVVECHFDVILCILPNRKCDFFQVHKKTNQVVVWHYKVFFCLMTLIRSRKLCFKCSPRTGNIFILLTSRKSDLGEVEKAMFQGLACRFELIFGFLTIPICDLVEVEKSLFHGLAWHFQLIFGLWTSQKCELVKSKKGLFSGCKALRSHFRPLDQTKRRFE